MNQFLFDISQKLGLTQTLTPLDLGILVFIFILTIVAFSNLFGSDDEKIQKDSTDTPKLEIEKEDKVVESDTLKVEEPKEKEKLVEEAPLPESTEEKPEGPTWEKRLFKGLSRTRSEVWGKVTSILTGSKLDEEVVEELEEILFTSDLSPVLVDELLEDLKTVKAEDNHLAHIKTFLKSKMESSQEKVNTELYKFQKSENGPKVIMIVGVNGAGKTTTIGKLATKLKSQGASVVVGACDTFRAAAVEQLEVWCKRADVEIVKSAEGADPSGVAFDAVAKAKEINADYCIIDTAGRLHTKSNLMDELAKTKKVMSKVIPDAPHETLLVLDAITGQNALRQAEEFNKSLELSGLIFTKCDGSSKAGSAVSIVQTLAVPIVYIGVGEDVEDLDIFNLDSFLDALLGIEA
jgi:fused signal recognition particle receptor